MAKKYNLSEEEKVFLLGRRNVGKYVGALIESEMNKYIHDVVRKRLGIEETENIKVDLDKGIITKTDGKETK